MIWVPEACDDLVIHQRHHRGVAEVQGADVGRAIDPPASIGLLPRRHGGVAEDLSSSGQQGCAAVRKLSQYRLPSG